MAQPNKVNEKSETRNAQMVPDNIPLKKYGTSKSNKNKIVIKIKA